MRLDLYSVSFASYSGVEFECLIGCSTCTMRSIEKSAKLCHDVSMMLISILTDCSTSTVLVHYRLLSHSGEKDEGGVASGSGLTSGQQTSDQTIDDTQIQQPKSLKCEEWVVMAYIHEASADCLSQWVHVRCGKLFKRGLDAEVSEHVFTSLVLLCLDGRPMRLELSTRTSQRPQRKLSHWQKRKKQHSWKGKVYQYARCWYMIDAGWKREWNRGDRREKRKRKKWGFQSFHGMTLCTGTITAAPAQEAIDREKIRRKGGKDITDLKQKWEKALSIGEQRLWSWKMQNGASGSKENCWRTKKREAGRPLG
jgi:hypothetical protein